MRSRNNIAQSDRRARGLTLIELMVAMAIIVIVVLAVGQIMTSAQKVVAIGQANMRSNGKIGALKSIVRDDLRRITKMGFLYLDSYQNGGVPASRLIFTTAGPSDTITGSGTGCGGESMYGLRSVNNTTDKVLVRVQRVLGAAPPAAPATDDYVVADFSYYQTCVHSAADVDDAFMGLNPAYLTGGLNVLQQDLTATDITQNCWRVMTTKVTRLEVSWTDGALNGSDLKWYGGAAGTPSGDARYAAVETGNGSNYKARWSNANPNDWPKAIKYVITMDDEAHTGTPMTYEVICPIGQ